MQVNQFDAIAESTSRIDVRASRAYSEHDREMIAAAVCSSAGGFNFVNGRVQCALRAWLQQAAETLLASRKATHGDGALETAAAKNALAKLLVEQGADKAQDALPLFLEVLASRTAALGPDDVASLEAMGNVAHAQAKSWRSAASLETWRAALDARRRVLGANHPLALAAMSQLANAIAMNSRGDDATAEAEALHREGLALMRAAPQLGISHPDTLIAAHNFALFLLRRGMCTGGDLEKEHLATQRREEAFALLRDTLSRARDVYGDKHIRTLTTLVALAVQLSYHNSAEAEVLYREALRQLGATVGEAHPQATATRAGLAELLRKSGRKAEAEQLYRDTLARVVAVAGRDHVDVVDVTAELAEFLPESNEKIELWRWVLARRCTLLGAVDDATMRARRMLANALWDAKRGDEAEELLRAAVPACERALGITNLDWWFLGCLKCRFR